MKLKLLIACFVLSSMSYGQTKNQYITVTILPLYQASDTIKFSIDTLGLKPGLQSKLLSVYKNFRTETELFNALGNLGWELYLIEDVPNRISPTKDPYSGTPLQGEYSLYRDGRYAKRLVYFKWKY